MSRPRKSISLSFPQYVALLFVCDVGSIVAGVLIGALIIR